MYSCLKESDGAMAGLYGLLFVTASVQCARVHRRVPGEFTMQKVIHLLVGVFGMFRTVSYALNALLVLERPARAFYVMWTLGGCLFFSLYGARRAAPAPPGTGAHFPSPLTALPRPCRSNAGHAVGQDLPRVQLQPDAGKPAPAHRPHQHRLLRSPALYICAPGLAGGLAPQVSIPPDPGPHNPRTRARAASPPANLSRHWQPLFLGASSVAAACAVVVYGYRIMSAFGTRSPAQHATWRRVTLVTTVATLCFFTRGAADFCWAILFEPLAPCAKAITLSLFYPFVEVLPCTTVLCAMSRLPPPTASMRGPPYAKTARAASSGLGKPLLDDAALELDLASPDDEDASLGSSRSSLAFSDAGGEEGGGRGSRPAWGAQGGGHSLALHAPGRRRGSSATSATSGTHLSRTGRPLDAAFSAPGSSLSGATGGVAPLFTHPSSRHIASLPNHADTAPEAASASIRSSACDDPGRGGSAKRRPSSRSSAGGAREAELPAAWPEPRGARARTEGTGAARDSGPQLPAGPDAWPGPVRPAKHATGTARAASPPPRGSSARGALGGAESPVESTGGRESATL